MYRGTTPSITLKLNTTINFDEIEKIWVTISSKIKEVTIEKDRMDFDNEAKRISFTLTQEETLCFNEGNAEIQARIKMINGKAYCTTIDRTKINKILKDGVI